MRTWVLGSGSAGNAVLVECAPRSYLLIDAGFPPAELARRLASIAVHPREIEGVVVTHEHTDHARGAAAAARKWKWPIYATRGTVAASIGLGRIGAHTFAPGETVALAEADVESVRVAHDAAEPVALIVTARRTGARTAIVYDLGEAGPALRRVLHDIDVLVLEANHDRGMLRAGPYPPSVQRRIASRTGHLSNEAAARLARDCAEAGMGELVLAHLSTTCNDGRIALGAVANVLAPMQWTGRVHVAQQEQVVGPFVGRARRLAPVQLTLEL